MEKKEDSEELSIDLSKITRFFGKKKKEHEHHASEEHTAEETKKEERGEEVSLNFATIKNFSIKYGVVFLIVVAMLLAIVFRMQSMYLPMTDEWAQNTVYNYYKAQMSTQIDQQYPNLPAQNKNTLVEQQFQTFLNSNQAQINQQIQQVSQSYKTHYEDSNGYTFMPDIDPYYYLREARNYLDHGYIGDVIINGTEWDNHMTAPIGRAVPIELHPYVLAYEYLIMHIFNPKITLMQSAGYFPVIFSALAVIPAFFIGRKMSNTVGGFFAAVMLAINPAFINRTLWGHANTNPYNVTMPLFIAWLFLEAISAKDRKRQVAYACVSGLLTGIYSFAWTGWWYIFDFILGTAFIYLIYLVATSERNFKAIKENKKITTLVFTTIILIIASGLFVSLFKGPYEFFTSPIQPLVFSNLKVAVVENLWPNVYTTVAELNPSTISQSIDSVGGNLLFLISLIGIVFAFFKKDEHGNRDASVAFGILAVLWYIGIFYASTKGVRFTMMLAPPFSLGFGTTLGVVYDKSTKYVEKEFEVKRIISGIVLIILFSLLLISPAQASWYVATHDLPIMNDAWFTALDKIRTDSQKDAIINSWWDFGHHFKYVADRAVTFDGASQVTPQAHWIGKVLLTDDEQLAAGILRMLDCGANNAFDVLDKEVNDVGTSVDYLDHIVKMNKEDARAYLQGKNISDSTINSVLGYTHCTPPEDYFITSEDMVGKAGVWAHFGAWDFNKAYLWVYGKNLPFDDAVNTIMQRMNVSKQRAQQLYYEVKAIPDDNQANSWIAPWPSYAGAVNCVNSTSESFTCENGISANLTTMDVEIPTQQGGTAKPQSLVYETPSGINEMHFNSTAPYSAALVTKNGATQLVLMDPVLAESMFTRLFYFEGYKLKYFEPLIHTRDITGQNIYVWKVNWAGNATNG